MNSNISIGVIPHTAENAIRSSRSMRGRSIGASVEAAAKREQQGCS